MAPSRRIGPRYLELFVLVPLLVVWTVSAGLSLQSVVNGVAFSSIYVAGPRTTSGYPRVVGFKAWLDAEESDIAVGDHLLRLGEHDLRGIGEFGFWVRVASAAGDKGRAVVALERDGRQVETALPLGLLASYAVPFLPASASLILTATWLLLRAPRTQAVRAMAYALGCFAVATGSYFGGSPRVSGAQVFIHMAAWTLWYPLVLRAMLLFPSNAFHAWRWPLRLAWIALALGPLEAGAFYGFPVSPSLAVATYYPCIALIAATVIAIGTENYRRADPVGRRKLKWMLFGTYCAVAPMVFGYAVAAMDPRFAPLAFVTVGATVCFPIFLAIAIVRFDLLDVDRLLSATASYNLALVLIVGGGFVTIPRLTTIMAESFGLGEQLGQILLSFLLASILLPTQQRLRPLIDRTFFPERYALRSGMTGLLERLSLTETPEALTRRLGEGLSQLLRPEPCVVYARDERAFAPLFARGRAVPPAFPTDSTFVSYLETREEPAVVGRMKPMGDSPLMSELDRATLDTLDAEVVVPIRRGEALHAFVCLGPKRSGDIYTRSDLTLLRTVSDRAGGVLLHFEEAEIVRQERQMRQALRQYVPGVVAESLAEGEEIKAAAREVSILFVDIRGYTSFSEPRSAEAVFSTVDRYTQHVSQIVRDHGGSVVEFHGDGLMAIFGAPKTLQSKESAAVAAGRHIVETIAHVGEEAASSEALSVGVGIATGESYVGNIRAVDRVIWTAIGNSVNFAARLESMTRELNASMVIDEATWMALGPSGTNFQRFEEVQIRGRTGAYDVFALPLVAPESDGQAAVAVRPAENPQSWRREF